MLFLTINFSQVVLTKGIAKVPVSELNGLLKLVFKGFIVHGMSKAENWLPHAMMDPRIKNLIHNCKVGTMIDII